MNDMTQLEYDYGNSRARGVMRRSVLREYLMEQEVRRLEILARDRKLDEEARQIEGWYPQCATLTIPYIYVYLVYVFMNVTLAAG